MMVSKLETDYIDRNACPRPRARHITSGQYRRAFVTQKDFCETHHPHEPQRLDALRVAQHEQAYGHKPGH